MFQEHDDLENDEIEPVNIWEDNWDDDNIEDDFSLQLKYFENSINYFSLIYKILFFRREFNGRTFHGPIV